jgi:tetratricopeptide (TPR) repeat protein
MGILFSAFVCLYGQVQSESNNVSTLIDEGNAALAQGQLKNAAVAFQHAVDLDPSSARAHEQLGSTLLREIVAGVRPSADSDIAARAEDHLKQATELAPFEPRPLIELSELEAALAERSEDSDQRSDRYREAQDQLKKVLALSPGKADMYLRLATLERDEFGPAIERAMARSRDKSGPIDDSDLRHQLQQQYGSLVEDAVANARRASEMSSRPLGCLLLMSRLLRERAALQDKHEQYASDIHSADDWQQQFLVNGGHLSSGAH